MQGQGIGGGSEPHHKATSSQTAYNATSAAYSATHGHLQTKPQQAAKLAKEPSSGHPLRHRDRANNQSQPVMMTATKVTKQQVAREYLSSQKGEYYMMQTQPHQAASAGKNDHQNRQSDQTPQTKRQKQKDGQQNFISTSDQATTNQNQSASQNQSANSRSTKALLPSTQSAYYAYTMTKHAKVDMTGGVRRSSTGNTITCGSDPQTQKRQVQSAHGSERTPKTPHSANIFRRKWGGASSTKSQKSVSSNRSGGLATSAIINCGQTSHTNAARSAQAPGEITSVASTGTLKPKRTTKKEKSRPNSSSKTSKHEGYTTSKVAKVKESPNILTVFETPPITINKGMRSSSNEIRGEQIDFTLMAKNRLLTMSNKKQFGNIQNPHATPQSAQIHGFGLQSPAGVPGPTPVSSQMPPRHQPKCTGGSQAVQNGGKSTKRRVSKSKSITRQNASAATPAMTSLSASQKQFKKAVVRNGGITTSQSTHANLNNVQRLQAMQTIDGSASRSKKLKTLLNSATGSKEPSKGGFDVGLGVGTPRRNSLQKGQTVDSISNRRVSQNSPPKKAKAGQAATQQNSVRQKKHMASVMQSRDKLPPSQNGATTKVSTNLKMSVTNDTARSGTNTCPSNQGQLSHERKKEMESQTKKGGVGGTATSNQTTTVKEKTGGEKLWKSHRAQMSTQQVETPAFLPHAATGNRNRNRSSSNQKQQQSSNSAAHTQTNLNSNCTVKETSQTDTKRKEPGKRKKSQTRRGKSAKTRGRSPHRAPIPPQVPVERYHSPQISSQTFHNFRNRLLKPKKPTSGGGQPTHFASCEKEYLTTKQGGFSGEKSESQQITVQILNTDSKTHHLTKVVNSSSATNSISSATNINKKEARLRNKNQQQKMLSNIQTPTRVSRIPSTQHLSFQTSNFR